MPTRSSIRIRTLRIGDYRKIYALWKDAEGVGLGDSDSRVAIGRYLKRNRGLSLVATSGGRLIAVVLCGHDGRRGYLHHLAVARKWRRQGIGRKLVAACLDNSGRRTSRSAICFSSPRTCPAGRSGGASAGRPRRPQAGAARDGRRCKILPHELLRGTAPQAHIGSTHGRNSPIRSLLPIPNGH